MKSNFKTIGITIYMALSNTAAEFLNDSFKKLLRYVSYGVNYGLTLSLWNYLL